MISSLWCYSLKGTYPQKEVASLLDLMASEMMPFITSGLFLPPLKVLIHMEINFKRRMRNSYFLLFKQHLPISFRHCPGKHLLTLWWIGSVCMGLLSFPLPVFFIPMPMWCRFSTPPSSISPVHLKKEHSGNSKATTHKHWGSCHTKWGLLRQKQHDIMTFGVIANAWVIHTAWIHWT